MEKELLECGHYESDHSDITRGYATNQEGKRYCYDCAYKMELEDIKTSDKAFGYLNTDKMIITDWIGNKLFTVTSINKTRSGFQGYTRNYRYYFQAVDLQGNRWYGNSPGNNMYARLRRNKTKEDKCEN